jgi:DNA-binding NtrC family response regulator
MSGSLDRHLDQGPDAAPAVRVLVVDDEMLIRWALGQALGARGCLVTEAANACEARAALRARDCDVAVLDYRLPDTTHLELLRDIRKLSPSSRVVLMTAYGTREMIEEALELGASRVLEKPIDLDVAVQVILDL